MQKPDAPDAPHPVRGYSFELQTFTCRACQHEMERDADRLGEVTPNKHHEQLDGALQEPEDQWLDDFILRLHYTLEDIVCKR